MASNILLFDPVLAYLNPLELSGLKGVNQECNTTIQKYELTQRTYDANSLPVLPWKQRKQLYSRYPSIEYLKLNLKVESPLTLKEFLRPTLKRIDITLQLSLDRHPESKVLHLWCTNRFLETFQDLIEYTHEFPAFQLEALKIQISKSIIVGFTDRESIHVGYDKYGSVYEDYEWSEQVDGFDPSVYIAFLDPNSEVKFKEICAKVSELAKCCPCKTLTLPDIFTKQIECNESIKEELQEVLDDIQYG
jgi:hypothetical protein